MPKAVGVWLRPHKMPKAEGVLWLIIWGDWVMSFEWVLTKLGNLIEIKHGFAFKGEFFSEKPTNYQLVTPANFLIGGGFQTGKNKYYSGTIPTDYILKKGDIIVTMTDLSKQADTLGYSARVPETDDVVWLHNQRIGLVKLKQNIIVDSDFLYYLLCTDGYRHWIVSSATGSTVKHTSPSRICEYEFYLPPINIQKSVGQTLSSLDNRISLLRETNTTLEAIAQTLFKSWFVDFDPVKAKAQGKQPEGMDEATAALFPSEFEESALGLIPKGWNYCSFIDTINVIGGGTPKTSIAEYWNGEIPWFSVVDAPSTTDVFVIDTEKHITEIGLKNSSTKLLSEGVTIISARGTVGKLALVGQKMAMNQSCYGLQGKAGDAYFTYFSTSRLVEVLKQRTHGSVFDTITRDTFGGVSVVYPSVQVINAFEIVVSGVMDRIKINLHQSQTLTTLRDTLLPRLISGQLRINQAQDLINEVGA